MALPLLAILFATKLSETGANITATISNSTGQYFIASESWIFRSETITCNDTTLCYFECNSNYICMDLVLHTSSLSVVVNCNGRGSCRGNFNLSLSESLFFNCNAAITGGGGGSCQYLNVYIANNDGVVTQSTAYIKSITAGYICGWCDGIGNFHMQNMDIVNMICDGYSACSDSTTLIYVPSGRENSFNLRCMNGGCDRNWGGLPLMVNGHYTLKWLNVSTGSSSCGDSSSCVTVKCIDDLGKYTGSISSAFLEYNGVNVCEYYSNCCPYSSVKISNDNYTKGWYINDCIDGEVCFIDCSSRYETTGVLSECGYRIINGSLSKSVSVICPEKNSCDNLEVICPINGGQCNVTVPTEYGSNGLRINAISFIGNDLNINLNCLAVGSCYGSKIFASNTMGNNINMNINCLSPGYYGYSPIYGACHGLSVDGSLSDLNNINIQCNGIDACGNTIFELQNATNIDVKCDGIIPQGEAKGSCTGNTFHIEGAENIKMQCISNKNCKQVSIYSQRSNSLDIVCDGDQSCWSMDVHYPPSFEEGCFTLKCYDALFDYSCDAMLIYLEDNFITNFINLTCESNKACNYIGFMCDTKGNSILNPDNYYYSCLDNNCCPIQRTRSPTQPIDPSTTSPINLPTTSPFNLPTTSPINLPTVSPNNLPTTSPFNLPTASTNNLPTASTVYNAGSSATSSTDLSVVWIVLTIIGVLFVFVCAIYVSYKIGMKRQIPKQHSFELVNVTQLK
eukprot:312017_1